jgi:hypothetical protein
MTELKMNFCYNCREYLNNITPIINKNFTRSWDVILRNIGNDICYFKQFIPAIKHTYFNLPKLNNKNIFVNHTNRTSGYFIQTEKPSFLKLQYIKGKFILY